MSLGFYDWGFDFSSGGGGAEAEGLDSLSWTSCCIFSTYLTLALVLGLFWLALN